MDIKNLKEKLSSSDAEKLSKLENALTPNQRKFAYSFLQTGNATKSYKDAYATKSMSYATIRKEGQKTRTKPHVGALIEFWINISDSSKIMKADEALQGITAIARGTLTSKELADAGSYIDIYPTITDRYRAYESILKRYPLSDLDKAQIKRAQADAIKSETEAKLAQHQIDDHNTASGAVVDALKDMPKEEIVKLARKVGNERNANNASNAKSETSG